MVSLISVVLNFSFKNNQKNKAKNEEKKPVK